MSNEANIAANHNAIITITRDRIVEIDVLCDFSTAVNEIVLEDNQIDDDNVPIVITGAFGLNGENYSAFLAVPDLITAIANITRLIDAGVKYRLKFRLDTTAFVESGDHTYKLYDLSVDSNVISRKFLNIRFLDNYRYAYSKEFSKSILNPYANTDQAVEFQRALADTVARTWGHEVNYLKVTTDQESANHTFKLYENYFVSGVKLVKVMIPDNDFKDRQIVYTDWNVTYEEDLEIHVNVDMFQRAFGAAEKPEAYDIIYVPQINTLFDVVHARAERGFMNHHYYHKLILKKHVKSSNIDMSKASTEDDANTTDFDIAAFIDTAVRANVNLYDPISIDTSQQTTEEDIVDNNQEQATIEGLQAAQSASNNYLNVTPYESLRTLVHEKVSFADEILINFGVKFSVIQYDLTNIGTDVPAINYAKTSTALTEVFLSFWHRTIHRRNTYTVLQFGTMRIKWNEMNLELWLDGVLLQSVALTRNRYYFIAVILKQQTLTAEFIILARSSELNALTSQQLQEIHRSGSVFASDKWLLDQNGEAKCVVYGGQQFLTNLRIYRKSLDETAIHKNATDYTVDYTDSIIIDNTTKLN